MRTARVFLCLPALVLVVALAGCAGRGYRPGTGQVPPEGTVAPPGKLKFLITITPSRFALGQRVALEASLFNQGESAYEHKCPTSCVWDYEVVAEDGHRVGPARDCLPEKTELRLEPGELRMIMRNWSGRDHYFGADEPLAPGTYKVTAGLVDEGGQVVPMMEPVEFVVTKGR